MFDKKTILITGGTGSFGQAFITDTLSRYNPRRLIILSRDEMKQWHLAKQYSQDPRIRFFIGDVRDSERLKRAFQGVDYVVHAAATKIVPTAEYNPFEAVKTNIIGAMNVINAALDCGVEKVVALSTDKASSPVNLYGATKLVSDKLFVQANAYASSAESSFSVVRYGNVMGSRGSIIPFFREAAKSGTIPITDFEMTRFMISLPQAVDLVSLAITSSKGGEIYVRKIPSMSVVDIAKTIAPKANLIEVGIRPGEKIHEQMIGPEDAPYTYDFGHYYKILPAINSWSDSQSMTKDGQLVPTGFRYSSDSNDEWMQPKDLEAILRTLD